MAEPGEAQRTGSTIGLLLGFANVIVIALAMAAESHESGVGELVFLFGILPGAGAGLILGIIGDSLAHRPRPMRYAILAAPALVVLATLARMFELLEYVPVAGIPTLISVILLEGATYRPRTLAIPAARVHR